MIEVSEFTKYYGNTKAVDNISFKIEKGEIVGFLGPNGAGKTTTMRVITGFLYPTKGSIKVAGYDIRENPVEAKKFIGYLPENVPLYSEMSVTGYLDFVADIKGLKKNGKDDHIAEIINRTGLNLVSSKIISKLSKGFKQRIGIAQALVGDPDILILDEPTIGLDPNQIVEIRNLIRELGKKKTIMLSSHILQEVSAVCKRIIIINEGRVVAEDTKESLMRKMETGQRIRMIVDNEFKKVKEKLLEINGVINVDLVKTEDSLNEIIVGSEKDKDIRKELSKKIVESGFNLLEQSRITMSLEEVFAKLTK